MTDTVPRRSDCIVHARRTCHIAPSTIDLLCKVLDTLMHLLQNVFPPSLVSGLERLKEVRIVPDAEMESSINEIAQQVMPLGKHLPGGARTAATIPIEGSEGVDCYVVINEKELDQIEPENLFPIISTLLEELLHVQLYSFRWRCRGCYLAPRADSLLILCSNLHDEYIVSKWKSAICASVPLISHDGEPSICFIYYEAPLGLTLDRALSSLSEVVTDGARGRISTTEAWDRLMTSTYRDVFEPLARESGFRAGAPESPQREGGASESWFYRVCVLNYWEEIQAQMERSFQSQLVEMDAAIDQIVTVVTRFLNDIGVTYHRIGSDSYWVNFHSGFFDGLPR